MRIRRFEQIDAWKTARNLTKDIYAVSTAGAFHRDFALRDQIRRAATSVMANIAEGFSRRSDREFVQFLFVSKASAAELQSHLYVALDQSYVNPTEFEQLYDKTDHCASQVSNFITFLLGHSKG